MNWEVVFTPKNIERLLVGNFAHGEPGGLLLTVTLGISAIFLSTLFAVALAMARESECRPARIASAVYVDFFRNLPLLLIIFWVYFLPPVLGFEISKFLSVLISLTLFTAAYVTEVLRSGIRSIPSGEIEAAHALGLNPLQITRWVVLPQAFYSMLPALSGRYVTAIKNTSLAFLIGLSDLTDIGRQINNRLMTSPIEVYFSLLCLYLIVNSVVSGLMYRLENRAVFNKLFLRI